MKTSTRIIIASIVTLLVAAIGFYIMLPAINPYSQEAWFCLLFLIIIWGVVFLLTGVSDGVKVMKKKKSFDFSTMKKGAAKWIIIAAAVPILVLVVGNIASSTFFNAHAYSTLIEVPEAVFEDDMPENDTVTNIALMDSSSATIIGNRTLGALSDVVSQYEAGESYSQINYGGAPAKHDCVVAGAG